METATVSSTGPSKSRMLLIKIALLCFGPFMVTAALVDPALAAIQADLPHNYPDWLIQNVATIISISIFIVGVTFPLLERKFSLRALGITGMFLCILFELLPVFANSIWAILVCRLFAGFGIGLCYICSSSLIVEWYTGKERAQMMSWSIAVMQGCSIFFPIIAGHLAVVSWRLNFLFNLVLAIPMVLFIIGLRKGERGPYQASESKKAGRVEFKSPAKCWYTLIFCAVMFLVSTAFMIAIAQELVASGLGQGPDAGKLISLQGAVGFAAAIFYPRIRRAFGRWALLIISIIGLAAYLLSGFATSIGMLYAAAALVGCNFGMSNAEIRLVLAYTAGDAGASRAYGYFNAVVRLTGFFMPFALAGIVALLGIQGAGATMLATVPVWIVTIVMAVILAVWVYPKSGGIEQATE